MKTPTGPVDLLSALAVLAATDHGRVVQLAAVCRHCNGEGGQPEDRGNWLACGYCDETGVGTLPQEMTGLDYFMGAFFGVVAL